MPTPRTTTAQRAWVRDQAKPVFEDPLLGVIHKRRIAAAGHWLGRSGPHRRRGLSGLDALVVKKIEKKSASTRRVMLAFRNAAPPQTS